MPLKRSKSDIKRVNFIKVKKVYTYTESKHASCINGKYPLPGYTYSSEEQQIRKKLSFNSKENQLDVDDHHSRSHDTYTKRNNAFIDDRSNNENKHKEERNLRASSPRINAHNGHPIYGYVPQTGMQPTGMF